MRDDRKKHAKYSLMPFALVRAWQPTNRLELEKNVCNMKIYYMYACLGVDVCSTQQQQQHDGLTIPMSAVFYLCDGNFIPSVVTQATRKRDLPHDPCRGTHCGGWFYVDGSKDEGSQRRLVCETVAAAGYFVVVIVYCCLCCCRKAARYACAIRERF